MKTFQVIYTVNEGPMKDKRLTVLVKGIDVEDAKKRFERTTQLLAPHYSENYKAEMVLIDEIESKSRLKRLETQTAANNLLA